MNPEEVFWPPEILFKGGSHHQFVRMTTDYFEDFVPSGLRSLRTINVTSSRVSPIDSRIRVPNWNISGLDGDIHQKVEAAMFESCEP